MNFEKRLVEAFEEQEEDHGMESESIPKGQVSSWNGGSFIYDGTLPPGIKKLERPETKSLMTPPAPSVTFSRELDIPLLKEEVNEKFGEEAYIEKEEYETSDNPVFWVKDEKDDSWLMSFRGKHITYYTDGGSPQSKEDTDKIVKILADYQRARKGELIDFPVNLRNVLDEGYRESEGLIERFKSYLS